MVKRNSSEDLTEPHAETKPQKKYPKKSSAVDPANKLNFGEFHRIKKDKKKEKRVVTNKKRIRDLERLIAKEGVHESVKE